MNKKQVLKIAVGFVVAAVPFGLVTIGGYYAYKKYQEKRSKAKKGKEIE